MHDRNNFIYQTIRDRICCVEYPPGSVLYETKLAKEFDVSRTPIRNSLTALQHDGLISVKHGVGNIVSLVEPDELIEIYNVRMILAQAAGDFFAVPFHDGTVEMFEEFKSSFQSVNVGDIVGFGRANNRYYTGLTGLITNSCLSDTMLRLFFQTSRMWLVSLPSLDWTEVIQAVSDELDEVIRLVRLEDPVGLGLAARNHVFMTRKRVLSGLGISLKT